MKKNLIPPFLKEGDKAVIVSPSGNIDVAYVDAARDVLEYSYDVVAQSLMNGQPVLARGYCQKISYKLLGVTLHREYTGGHAWIIDGLISNKRLVTTTVEVRDKRNGKLMSHSVSSGYEYNRMLHNNWGWDGAFNGYFAEGSFDSYGKKESSSLRASQEEIEDNAGESGNFQYNNQIFPFIRR